MLQRDFRSFNPKPTTQLSTRITYFSGYINTKPYVANNISWTPGSQVDMAFQVLWQMLADLASGTYQVPKVTGGKNPGIWPPATVNWQWIRSLYAFNNPAYAAWLVTNGITVPAWGG